MRLFIILIMLLAPSIVLSSENYQKSRQLSESMLGLYVMADMCENVTAYDSGAIKKAIEDYYIEQTGIFENPIQGQLEIAVSLKKDELKYGKNKDIYTVMCDVRLSTDISGYNQLRKDWEAIGILEPPNLNLKIPPIRLDVAMEGK